MRVLATNNYDMEASAAIDAAVRDGASEHFWGCDRLESHGVDVEILPFEKNSWLKRFSDKVKFLGNLDQQLRILRSAAGYDVVYCGHAVSTSLLAFCRGLGLFPTPIVAVAYQTPRRKSVLARFFVRRCLGGHDELLCMTDGVRQDLEDYGVPPAKLSRMDWGLDLQEFDRDASGFMADVEALPKEFIFTSGKTYRDYPTLVSAAAQTDANLVICSSADRGVDKINTSGARNVTWIDRFLDLRSVRNIYRACRAVAISVDVAENKMRNSVGNTSLVEAMAASKPVLMTRVDFYGIDIEKEGMGYWIDHRDVDGWRRAIQHLWDHPKEAEEMGRRGRRIAETTFNIDHYAKDLAAALKRHATT